ncbi:hypothetical protein ACBJ59_10725 [Nonomuraea sp. MTCD27]|uniref:hypothetical protein n=1 Tax=Nonomuraea sp. MTCD27 TaxID=1676747 RepID=UPI0035BFFE5D
MTEGDLAEVAALAETLRATMASLNIRIEERARHLAANADLLLQAQRMGQSLRNDLIARAPEEAYDFLVGVPAEVWTSSGAYLLSDMYAEIARRERGKVEQRG